jgi:hypothetical protein
LEERTVPSWSTFGANPQHTGLSTVATQAVDAIHWQTSVDLNPTGAAVHYGSPVFTPANTIIIPVKTGASSGFEVTARNGATGNLLWTQTTDYTLPPHDWLPPFGPTLTPSGRLYYAGNGGTVYYCDNPDSPGATASGQLAFYGIANYLGNPGTYNTTVFIDTPITSDNAGNIYFGFMATGTNPSGLVGGGIARIDASGNGSYVLASAAANDSNISRVALSAAPALSNDGSTIYVAVNNTNQYYGYLLALNSTTLATQDRVFLHDPRNSNGAGLIDDSTATPMVAPDNTVFFGVFGNPYNGSRGFLLHFSGDLSTSYVPGAFGWDDTPSVVPASMLPAYHGSSSYLIFSKYNNYVAAEVGSTGGDGVNRVAILDPYASQTDTRNDGTNMQVMKEVLTVQGPTPDTQFIGQGYPNAVREWCINDTAIDPFTHSALVNSEDGNLYRWDLTTNTLTQVVNISPGVGEPYTPTSVGPDGTVYVINGGNLFALGAPTHYSLTVTASVDPVTSGKAVSFTVTMVSTNGGITPTGTIRFSDGSTTLATVNLNNGRATYKAVLSSVGKHFITASYSGNSTYAQGSTTLVEAVDSSASKVTVTSSANPSSPGQSVTFSLTVQAVAPATGTPTGIVTFLEGSTILYTTFLDSNGHASYTTSSLTTGSHAINVVYRGDETFGGSSTTFTQTVGIPTTTTLMSSPNPSTFGHPVTFTATVAASSGTPAGTVTFLDGGTVLGTAQLNSSGVATLVVSTLSLGTHKILAVYAGSGSYAGSKSNSVVQTVNSTTVVTTAPTSGSSTAISQPISGSTTLTAIFSSSESTSKYSGKVASGTSLNETFAKSKPSATGLDSTVIDQYFEAPFTAELRS